MSQAAASIFARIVAGEIPCHKVFENAHVLAFLDINPLAEGHTLVIPKRPVERLEDLTPDEVAEMARSLVVVARRVLEVTEAPAYNILQNNGVAAGQDVPYVHFHIVPRRPGDGLGYRWKAQKGDPARLAELAQRLRATP